MLDGEDYGRRGGDGTDMFLSTVVIEMLTIAQLQNMAKLATRKYSR